MSQQFHCSKGHEWEADDDATLAGCPECGAEIADDEYPDDMPPPPKPLPASTMFTIEPVASIAAELPQLPGYEVLREIGRGGMGVVYLARDRKLQRLVALKMILSGPHSALEERSRFRLEAETVARLQHPNIVQIFEIGEWNGQPYFALEYVDGGILAHQLGRPLAIPTAVRLAETLALAVQYAHDQGVVHRDLKPGNVLLSALGSEGIESAVPKITDFGLAKRLDTESAATQTGSILGTPNYMAPEQAAGRAKEIGPPTDVYALGAILYELLTGRPPFLGATPMETVLHVIHDEPASPRLLNPSVPRDLETICLKCLQKEPARRYPSATTLAEDLRRFTEGRPILARPVAAPERAWRLARRNPVAASLALAFIASLILGVVVATFFAVQSSRRAARNLEMKKVAERGLYLTRMNLASRAWEEGQVARVLELLAKTRPEATGGIDLRGFEWHYLWRRCHEHDLRVIDAHAAPIGQLAWSSRRNIVASAGKDGLVKLWNPANGELIAELRGHDCPVFSVAFSPDGKTAASGDEAGTIRIWNVETGECIHKLQCNKWPVRCLAFSSDGSQLLAGALDSVWQWRLRDGRGGRVDMPRSGVVYGLAWAEHDSIIATAGSYGQVMFHEAGSNAAASVRASESYLSALAVSADGKLAASGGLDGKIKIWDVATHELKKEFSGLAGDAAALAFSADGRFVISAGISGAVKVRDRQTGDERVIAHTGPVESFALSPDQKVVAVGGPDGKIKFASIDLHPAAPPEHLDRVYALAASPDGRTAASAGRDGTVRLWDVASGKSSGELVKGSQSIWCVAFSPDGGRLAIGDNTGQVSIWDATARTELAAWKAHPGSVWGIAFFRDGKRLATAGYDDASVCIWDIDSRTKIRTCRTRSDRAWCVAVSPDDRLVTGGGSRGDVVVWDAATGEPRMQLTKGDGWIWSLAFSPDGGTLAAGIENGTIARWNVATGDPLPDLPGHPLIVRTLGFFPDGQTLFSGGEDGMIKLWDLASGEERGRIVAHDGSVRSVTVTPDGKTLISCGTDCRVHFWRAESR